MSDLQPLTPADCDLRGLAYMPVDMGRLLESDLFLGSTGDEFKAAFALWGRSWSQVPAASLPNDERLLARHAGVSLTEWRGLAAGALRGWIECSDGRLYHPVVAEKALQAWIERLDFRRKGAFGNAKRYGNAFDPTPFEAAAADAVSCLQRVSPDLGLKAASLLQRHEKLAGASREPRQGEAKTSRSGSGRDTLPERGENAPADPNKDGWDSAIALLTLRGRMKVAQARSFFAKLLKETKLEARQLRACIVAAEEAGTPDPQAYLSRGAAAIASRHQGSKPLVNVGAWTDDMWARALAIWRGGKAWTIAELGPEPGQLGCRVPTHLLMTSVITGEAA